MIGVDVIEVSRISRAVKKHGDQFLNKIFDPLEVEYCYRHKNPAPHLAARFAAKEAVYKALSQKCKDLTWRQIVVDRQADGRPVCRVAHPKFKGIIPVSLSHTKNYAVACAVIQTDKKRSQK